jgi:hypothetical protein
MCRVEALEGRTLLSASFQLVSQAREVSTYAIVQPGAGDDLSLPPADPNFSQGPTKEQTNKLSSRDFNEFNQTSQVSLSTVDYVGNNGELDASASASQDSNLGAELLTASGSAVASGRDVNPGATDGAWGESSFNVSFLVSSTLQVDLSGSVSPQFVDTAGPRESIELDQGSTVIALMDARGVGESYGFNQTYTLQPGTYTLKADAYTVSPDGYGESTDVSYQVSLTSQHDTNAATVTGLVWLDENGNGKLDPLEQTWYGAQVYIDSNNNGVFDAGEPQSITDSTGRYTLYNLAPGVPIVVRETEPTPANFRITHAPAGGFYTLTPTAGQVISASFGNTPTTPSTIHGVVWNDLNANGNLDTGEPLLSGIQIYIDANKNGVFDAGDTQSVTDANGAYSFPNLTVGTYQIRETLAAGSKITHAPAVGFYTIALTGGQSVSASFGNVSPGRIYGIAWKDLNGNGMLDIGEPGFPGVQVYLDINKDGTFDTGDILQTADANGKYSFDNLAPGNYVLREIVPSGYSVTHAPAGYWALSLHPGQAISASFGNK